MSVRSIFNLRSFRRLRRNGTLDRLLLPINYIQKEAYFTKYSSFSLSQNKCISLNLTSNDNRYFSTESESINSIHEKTLNIEIMNILRKIPHPNPRYLNMDIVYAGAIQKISLLPSKKPQPSPTPPMIAHIELPLDEFYRELKPLIKQSIIQATNDSNSQLFNKIESVRITIALNQQTEEKSDENKDDGRQLGLKNVKNIIAVSSCKGGVGKSTMAVNIAYSLLKLDFMVGIFDSDIFGPSLPTMISPMDTDIKKHPTTNMLTPIEYCGLHCMSFGFVKTGAASSDPSTGLAAIRGPMVSTIVSQLIHNTSWGNLDYLIIDMPPGTSDIHLTLSQQIKIDANIVISTPSKLAFLDVVKGIQLFDRVNVPTIALIENMAGYVCTHCEEINFPFGASKNNRGGYQQQIIEQFGIQNAIQIPIHSSLADCAENGDPFVLQDCGMVGENALMNIFESFAKEIVRETENVKSAANANRNTWLMDSENNLVRFLFNDGSDSPVIIDVKYKDLRYLCQCAECINEFTNERIIEMGKISDDICVDYIGQSGNYAVSIVWNDKHRSIFSFERLKNMLQN